MVSGELIVQLFIIAGGILGYFKLRQEHTSQIDTLKVNSQMDRERIQTEMEKTTSDNMRENQKLIRETLAQERAESVRKDRSIEQLSQDNARHSELRAESETKAEERSKQIIVLERQLGNTINKALEEAKRAERELVRREYVEKENEALKQERVEILKERSELRARVTDLEVQVPKMEIEIEALRQQVAQLMKEKEALAAAVAGNEAA